MLQTPELPAVLPPSTRAKPRRHSQWLEIVDQWQSSGLSEQVFCDSIDVRLDTFRKHRYQGNKTPGTRAAGQTGFKPVKITQSAKPAAVDRTVIVLHASHCRLELPRDMAVVEIAALVNALGR